MKPMKRPMRKSPTKKGKKNYADGLSLQGTVYELICQYKQKKAGTSRTKKKSTISKSAYANMKAGFPKKKKKKAKA